MKNELSPLERSRQILQSLEEEEQKKRAVNKNRDQFTTQASPSSVELSEVEPAPGKSPVKPTTTVFAEEPEYVHPLLRLDHQGLEQGIILSEILGKPLARRRGRW